MVGTTANLTLLETLVQDVRHQFILAKADGVLDAGEVIAIAVSVASKLQRLGPLSGAEKKAVVMMALKKGMAAAGGVSTLPGLTAATPAETEAFETQLLAAASAALDMAVAVATGKLDLRKPSSWKSCLPFCSAALSAAVAFVPKDQAILREAMTQASAFGAAAAGAESVADLVPAAAAATQAVVAAAIEGPAVPAVAAVAAVEQKTAETIAAVEVAVALPVETVQAAAEAAPPATESGEVPSPEASAQDAPAPSGEVKFE